MKMNHCRHTAAKILTGLTVGATAVGVGVTASLTSGVLADNYPHWSMEWYVETSPNTTRWTSVGDASPLEQKTLFADEVGIYDKDTNTLTYNYNNNIITVSSPVFRDGGYIEKVYPRANLVINGKNNKISTIDNIVRGEGYTDAKFNYNVTGNGILTIPFRHETDYTKPGDEYTDHYYETDFTPAENLQWAQENITTTGRIYNSKNGSVVINTTGEEDPNEYHPETDFYGSVEFGWSLADTSIWGNYDVLNYNERFDHNKREYDEMRQYFESNVGHIEINKVNPTLWLNQDVDLYLLRSPRMIDEYETDGGDIYSPVYDLVLDGNHTLERLEDCADAAYSYGNGEFNYRIVGNGTLAIESVYYTTNKEYTGDDEYGYPEYDYTTTNDLLTWAQNELKTTGEYHIEDGVLYVTVNDGANAPARPSGSVTTNGEAASENYGGADLDYDGDLGTAIPLTAAEQDRLDAGENISVYSGVADITDEVTDEEKELVSGKMGEDDEALLYLDVNLYKKLGTDDPVAVEETSDAMTLTFQVPTALAEILKNGLYVVRIHNGVAEIVPAEINGNLVSFDSDRFSTFAIVASAAGTDDSDTTDDDTASPATTATTEVTLKVPNTGRGADKEAE